MPGVDSVIKIIEETIGQKPARSHILIYDSPSETLEPVYFWTLDLMKNFFGGKVEKLLDNFSSSPGSGHFSELSQKKTILQKNVSETLGTVNTVIKSIINLIYDLKDFEIRLEHYNASRSENKEKKWAGILALKQIWMDNVDIKRGQGSINALTSGNLQFVTLRDAFMAANTIDDVENLDLNDRVKRLLKPRIAEFLDWQVLSEKELKARFNIEKNYLKSQVNMLQLYTRWIKPYLKSASELEMKEYERSPELVTAFNTVVLELAIFGKNELNFQEAIIANKIPKGIKKPKRTYYSCVLIDFHFRGIPQKAGQHYLFGGRVTVTFKAYSLNSDEISLLDSELKKSDINDALKLIEGATTQSLEELQKDIDHFLKENNEEEKKKEEKKQDNINPFTALFDIFKAPSKKDDKNKKVKEITDKKQIKKESYVEKLMRKSAAKSAEENCYDLYDVYKKGHGMASHDNPSE